MTKLSIIVPVYNVEQYLRKCVDSLLNQDMNNYEIILVDDGSTDSCPSICDEYGQMYDVSMYDICKKSIRVIHQKNRGLSAARNSGIKVAQGEYLMFVDSDDYIDPNVLGSVIKRVDEEQLDVLRYNYQNVRLRSEGVKELTKERDYEVFNPNKDPKRDVDYSESVVDGETFLNERLGPGCYAWQFILRRDLIYTSNIIHNTSVNNVLFAEGIYFEDTEWTPRMLLRAKRVASTKNVVYNYFWRVGSITLPDNPQKRKKVIEDKIALICEFQNQQKLVKDSKWFVWMTSSIAFGVLNTIAVIPYSERKAYINQLIALNVFPLATKYEKMKSHRHKMQIANLSPTLYCVLMSMILNIKH